MPRALHSRWANMIFSFRGALTRGSNRQRDRETGNVFFCVWCGDRIIQNNINAHLMYDACWCASNFKQDAGKVSFIEGKPSSRNHPR